MAKSNQRKKRKTTASKSSPSKKKEIVPVTFQEAAFINRTELPPDEPPTELSSIAEKLFQQVLEMMIKNFQQFLEAYGGYCSRDEAMKMFGISSKTTLNTWLLKGLPYYQVENKMLFKRSDLEKFLEKYRKIMSVLIVCLPGLPDAGMMIMAA